MPLGLCTCGNVCFLKHSCDSTVMARVRGTTSDFQPQHYIFFSPCNFGVAKDMVLVRRGVLGDVHRFFVFFESFFWGVFVSFWHFMVCKVVLGGRNQFGGKTGSTEVPRRLHGGSTEVPRRFHEGSTEVSGPTPKHSCNLRRNPHIPQNALNSQAFSGAPRVRPNVGCEPPLLQSRRVCFVSGGVVDPKLTKDPDAVVSRWVSGFRLGDLVCCPSWCFMSGLRP